MRADHAPLVAEFFRKVWEPTATAETVLRGRDEAIRNQPFFAGRDIPTVIFIRDNNVIGYVSSIPIQLWSVDQECPAFWVKGLMVLPEFRNGPIGFYLVKELLRLTPCALSLTVSSGSRRIFEGLGFKGLGQINNYVRILRPASMARKLDFAALGFSGVSNWMQTTLRMLQRGGAWAAAPMGPAMTLLSAIRRPRAGDLTTDNPDSWPDSAELMRLWQQVRHEYGTAAVRDDRYLPTRYQLRPNGNYSVIVAREHGRLAGIAILRTPKREGDPRLRGIGVATLSDILYPVSKPAIGSALLAATDRAAHELHADCLLVSTSSPLLSRLLSRGSYIRVPANMYFLFRDEPQSSLSSNLADWWLTRGDMNADEVF